MAASTAAAITTTTDENDESDNKTTARIPTTPAITPADCPATRKRSKVPVIGRSSSEDTAWLWQQPGPSSELGLLRSIVENAMERMSVCMSVCMYVCMYVCIDQDLYIHISIDVDIE